MSIKVPVIARLAFGDRVAELRTDVAEVEKLLHSDAENKRAGAVALLATQFELSKDVLVAKLKSCRIGERSSMVNGTILHYLRPLTITEESAQERVKIRTLAKASFETHLVNIQHGSYLEKRAALLFAFNRDEANPEAAQELCELAITDTDPEIRCGAMSAMAHPHYATSNTEVASTYARIALDQHELHRVRIYAAAIVLWIFGPYPLRRDAPTVNTMSSIEQGDFLEQIRKLSDHGVDGIDVQFLRNCLPM